MDINRIRKYANLVATVGLNVQKNQQVIIYTGIEQPVFTEMIVEECYKLGASEVRVDFHYDKLIPINVKYMDDETLGRVENWEVERLKRNVEVVPCLLFIESEDPDILKGIDVVKYSNAEKKKLSIVKEYRDKTKFTEQWCICSVPGRDWAKKLFPDLDQDCAVEKLWDLILDVSRIGDNPVSEWSCHNVNLHRRCDYLNSLKLRTLVYKSSNGTDFKVGLIPDSHFQAGSETNLNGITFNPNIPSEECFISPCRGNAEGIVYSTKPLSYQGSIIDNFWIRFYEGRAVEWFAETGNNVLTEMLNMDENSRYLGECALVPFDSPINKTGILFSSTLIDENACCHLAVGAGFEDCLDGFRSLSVEQAHEKGINDSIIHVDFMIGSSDLEIKGICENGKTVQIFKNGTWAF